METEPDAAPESRMLTDEQTHELLLNHWVSAEGVRIITAAQDAKTAESIQAQVDAAEKERDYFSRLYSNSQDKRDAAQETSNQFEQELSGALSLLRSETDKGQRLAEALEGWSIDHGEGDRWCFCPLAAMEEGHTVQCIECCAALAAAGEQEPGETLSPS